VDGGAHDYRVAIGETEGGLMKVSHRNYARRQALNVFDTWLDVTGVIERWTGYYDELCGIIETAVDIGAMTALEVPFSINDEGEAVEADKHSMTRNPDIYERNVT